MGRDYRFFYNPMWALLGDARSKTAGSYHYAASEHVSYFWNVFDQVLIRPDLCKGFNTETLKILTAADDQSLVRADGRPNQSKYSDHLPIVFELNF